MEGNTLLSSQSEFLIHARLKSHPPPPELYIFFGSAMNTIGAEVTQVSTNKLLRPRKNVKTMPPDVGKMSLGFASVVGTFDAIVDTISDESKVGESRCIGDGDDWSNGSDADECKSAVIIELEKQHECKRYV